MSQSEPQRGTVAVIIDHLVLSQFDEQLTVLMGQFQKLIDEYGPSVRIETEHYYDDVDIELVYDRPETDEEYNKRLKKWRDQQERNRIRALDKEAQDAIKRAEVEKREIELFHALKKKYNLT